MVMIGVREPRQATQVSNPVGSAQMPASAFDAAGDGGHAAGARRLLVGDRAPDDVALGLHTEPAQRLERHQHRAQAALHVAGAAPVEPAVAHVGLEGIRRPAIDGLRRDGVDVAQQKEAAAGPVAAQSRGQLRPAAKAQSVGQEAVADGRLGLPEVGLGADRLEACLEQPLQTFLVARRVVDVACGRVESDELADEVDELVAPRAHVLDDPLLER